MIQQSLFEAILAKHISGKSKLFDFQPVGGGCINTAIKLNTSEGSFFLKLNDINREDLFLKEQLGLQLLTKQSPLQIPAVLGLGTKTKNSYLLLEWIEKDHESNGFWNAFGRGLALQHKETSKDFGLDHSNYIGRLDQSNAFHVSWHSFFIHERLHPQIELARQAGLLNSTLVNQFDLLFSKLEELIPSEPPALLHGDLWSGNFICGPSSSPFLFDPAVHFGHRETELAFTTLFGGFDNLFYQTYIEEFPLAPGFNERIELHNLYPLLVHVNLFGASYLSGIEQTLRRFT